VPTSNGKGREWEKRWKGRGREREGEKGKDELHPTLFRPCWESANF